MSGLRERKKSRTRQAIVAAAMQLFAEQGFEQTTMAQLAHKAGIGKATIYGYFKTKDDIFIAFCEEEIEYAFSALDAKLDANAPLEELLVAQMMSQLAYVTRNREFGRIFSREMLFPRENRILKSREIDIRYFSKLGEVLVRAQTRGELPESTDLVLLIGHLHALYILTLSSLYLRDIETLEEAELMLSGLIRQALHGPAVVLASTEEEKRRWEELKELVLRRRHVELI